MTELREITKDNLEEVLKLEVFEYQKALVSSTAESLASLKIYYDVFARSVQPYAVDQTQKCTSTFCVVCPCIGLNC